LSQPSSASLFDRPLPPGYRDELQLIMAPEPAKPAPRGGNILLFQLGPLRLALPVKVASAVSPVLHIARIPHRSGTVLLGLVAFRGEILPCCSLARLLDVTQEETGAARMLVLQEPPSRLWVVPIDAVLGIRTLSEHHSVQAAQLAPQWLSATFADDSGTFHLLDNVSLFRQINLATA
jgi:chemotaxis signal transduction protein